MKRIFSFAFIAVALMQFSTLASRAQTATPTPRLTAAQATQIASSFCQAVGAPVTGISTAVFPAPLRYTNEQDSYFLPRWNVKFTGASGVQADVDVVDATGAVSRYYDFALSRQQLANTQAAGTPLSQATATSKATTYLTAATQPIEIGSPVAFNMQITSPATAAGNLWMIKWTRQYASISYRREQIIQILQAQTGALQALTISFPSPPPVSGAGSIMQGQAQATAAALLQTTNVPNPVFQAASLAVVQPTTYWQVNGATKPQPNTAGIVAWDCFYSDDNGMIDEVWVDSNTGNVIGGEIYGTAKLSTKSAKTKESSTKSEAKNAKPKAVK